MTEPALVTTRRALHAVAELVLAGAQHRACDDIRLRVAAGGFRTVAEPDLRVVGLDLVAGDRRIPISGSTPAALGVAVGIEAGEPANLYHDGSHAPLDLPLTLDPAAVEQIRHAYEVGDAALRLFAPDEEPVLWPEHFDVGIRVDDVNYGVSPGDGFLAEPYAYVGVSPVPADAYWNAPFGRTMPVTEFASAAELRDFFVAGRARFADGFGVT